MKLDRCLVVGLAIVIGWIFLDQVFDGSQAEHRALLLLPFSASTYVTISSRENGATRALLLIVPIVIILPLYILIDGEISGKSDFPGIAALTGTIPLSLFLGLAVVLPGMIVGSLWKAIRPRHLR